MECNDPLPIINFSTLVQWKNLLKRLPYRELKPSTRDAVLFFDVKGQSQKCNRGEFSNGELILKMAKSKSLWNNLAPTFRIKSILSLTLVLYRVQFTLITKFPWYPPRFVYLFIILSDQCKGVGNGKLKIEGQRISVGPGTRLNFTDLSCVFVY